MARWALSESQNLRFATLTLLYFTQGLPIGLFAIGLKPFLLQSGTTQEQMGALMAVVFLPWSLKIGVAPLMDTFTCRRFGFRRPWVVFGQAGLVCSLFSVGLLTRNGIVLHAIGALGFIVFFFAITQDVATDGMAIDILSADEQGRANAFMASAQRLGSSAMGALSAFLLPTVGLSGASFVCAMLVLPALSLIACVLERPGERIMPESQCTKTDVTGPTGEEPSERPEPHLLTKVASFASGLLLSRASLIILLMKFTEGVGGGIQNIVSSKLALTKGLDAMQLSLFHSTLSLFTGILGVLVGPLVDRFGAKRLLIISLAGAALESWSIHFYGGEGMSGRTLLTIQAVESPFGQMHFIVYLTLCMQVSKSLAAATQFAAMMAVSNLSGTVGDALVATGIVHAPLEWYGISATLKTASLAIALFIPRDVSSSKDSVSKALV